jgi:hypothetical protein
LNLTCDLLVSIFASKCNLYRYTGGALAWLKRNVDKNAALAARRGAELWPAGRLAMEACDWSKYQHDDEAWEGGMSSGGGGGEAGGVGGEGEGGVEGEGAAAAERGAETETAAAASPAAPLLDTIAWDFIVGSDLVYNEDGVFMLPRVIRSLLLRSKANGSPAPVAFYAHTKYRFETMDIDFFEALQTCGLAREEVREAGVPSPPASPEPYTELYPEKRIAVFRITLKEDRE